ncbi:hypothetical protein, partial [Sphingobacterium mizutaii]|uniref:hypothetical protein n=1 Tax=Sphingobacterium mizutaii TaxID=1010 RepID=UPI0028998429
IHVREPVRKATLNGPKRLRIRVVFGIRELLRRFGYFCAPKVTKNLFFVFFKDRCHRKFEKTTF